MTASSTALRPALVNARVLLDEALAGLANLDAPDIPVAAVEYGLVAALDAV